MSESQRTAIFAVLAVVSIVLARVTGPATPKPFDEINEVGEMFFPDFKDADAAKSLEVSSYNPDVGLVRRFGVIQDSDGRWRIPYAHNYPADGKEQLSKTAASMIGIKKEGFASRTESEHAEFGVLDPNAEGTSDFKGVGNRITLKDGAGKVLADYIIGKEAKGKQGYRYIRRPDQKATYFAKIDIKVSTKFVDWIESDLLKIEGTRLNSIVTDTTSVVEGAQATVVPGEVSRLTRKASADPWTMEGLDDAKEELNQDEIRKIVSALDDLKIVGVRPKPARLMQSLRDGVMQLDQVGLMDLTRKGFLFGPGRSGKGMEMYPKEGNLVAVTDQGVRYDLKFGEIFNGTEEEIEIGAKDEGKAGESGEKKAEEKKNDGKPQLKSRYLLVLTSFDANGLGPKPKPPEKPEPPEENTANVDENAAADATSPTNTTPDPKKVYEALKAKFDSDQTKYEADLADYKKKVEAGEKLVKSLNARFADWYYVVSGDSFENLRQGRKTLIKEKAADSTKAGTAADPADGSAPQN